VPRIGVKFLSVVSAIAVLIIGMPAISHALQSANYRFDESTIGTNTLFESSSTNYTGTSAFGDLNVGTASSTNYQLQAGSQTSGDPALTFSIDNSTANFGSFSATESTVSTATFSVINYTSYGYVVQITGDAPTNGAHVIDPLPSATAPMTGTEQFGINLVANTLPSSIGANPDNGDFGFGEVEDDYDDPNVYRFVSGDIIASAPQSSGETSYTITYLVNVEALTPGGRYDANQSLVVTGTY
jgi:hypothetical protein